MASWWDGKQVKTRTDCPVKRLRTSDIKPGQNFSVKFWVKISHFSSPSSLYATFLYKQCSRHSQKEPSASLSHFHLFSFLDDPEITHSFKTQQSFIQSHQVVGPKPQLFPFLSGFDCQLHNQKGYYSDSSSSDKGWVWHPWLYTWQFYLEYSRFGSVNQHP